jgi:uncharacterized protein YcfJ
MRPIGIATIAAALLVSAGCAGHRPVVDMSGVDPQRYEADLADCQRYASERSPVRQAATGAAGGAVFGVLLSAAFGSDYSRNTGAAVGAVTGGASGAAHGGRAQVRIVRNCLAGRGYRVLD